MDDFDELIRGRILLLLRATGTPNALLAKETGLAEGTVSNYLCGRRSPTLSAICRIADFFDASVDELCGRAELTDERVAEICAHRRSLSPGTVRRELRPATFANEGEASEFEALRRAFNGGGVDEA